MAFRTQCYGLLLLVSPRGVAADGVGDSIKLPVEVDQQGKTIYFVTDESSDVRAEAERFCRAHLRQAPLDDCTLKLVEQVGTIRNMRLEAIS